MRTRSRRKSALNYFGVMLSHDARKRQFGDRAVIAPGHLREAAEHRVGDRLLLGQNAFHDLKLQTVSKSRSIDVGKMQRI